MLVRKHWFAFFTLTLIAILFQNCGIKKDTGFKSSQSDSSSVVDSGSPPPTPAPSPSPGEPTASDIQDIRLVPGERATLLIRLNAVASADLVYTYSTADDSAIAGTHYAGIRNGNGGIFAGSATAQVNIETTNTAGVSYFGKVFKVLVNFPSKPALSKTVKISFSAAPNGEILKDRWAVFPGTALAPTPRWYHSSVWTGSRMIIFGGYIFNGAQAVIQNNGKSYDPYADTWVDINVTGGPGARGNHSAVWTGTKMIVWGGRADAGAAALNSGMAYDPVTNLWSPISSVNAPSARFAHAAVWTGTKMIVWGGTANNTNMFNDGGIYDPATDTWTPMNAAAPPTPRSYISAVWTGTRMIAWGGTTAPNTSAADGKAFDPVANTWTDINSAGAPSARGHNSAVWTGSKMIVWGGYNPPNVHFANGGIYDPVNNTWAAMSVANVPAARRGLSGVWTGASALYWGGLNNSGAFTTFNNGGIYY